MASWVNFYLNHIKNLYQNFKLVFDKHCVKNVLIRSYSVPHFPSFGLNPYLVRMQEMRIRITPNTDTFYANKELPSSKGKLMDGAVE